MTRGLPIAIDLVSLCVGAGLDFPRALHFVAGQPGRRSLVEEELSLVLDELSLGRTRAAALRGLAERTPCEAARSFVAAVTAGEEKGTPLSEVLRIQAGVLRGQRGVLAEEAAARAGVLLLVPLLLLLSCILLLLFAPFLLGKGLGT
jgi:tight adherence protein C